MELEEIQSLQLSAPVNGRLKRRTWIAVAVVLGSIMSIAFWSNHQVKKQANHYESIRQRADSLAHEERQLILRAVLETRRIVRGHARIASSDAIKAQELDSLFEENLKQQKE